jgi:malonyl-CoA O-methyltransferase
VNPVDRARLQAAFSRGARRYDALGVAQAVARDRVAGLLDLHAPAARRILDVGAGTGALAARLAGGRPGLRLALADLAPGMCAAAAAAVPRAAVIRADAEALPFAAGAFDAVLSSSTFQWLGALGPAVAEAARVLAPGGTLVLSLFAERTLHELRGAWLEVAGPNGAARLHRFFRREELAAALGGAGLQPLALEEAEIVERHPDARAVLRAIRAVGAGNAVPGGGGGLGGRRETLALLERYDRLGDGRGVPATYHVVYAVARRR